MPGPPQVTWDTNHRDENNFYWAFSLEPGLSALFGLSPFSPNTTPGSWRFCYPSFTDNKAKSLGDNDTSEDYIPRCPRLHLCRRDGAGMWIGRADLNTGAPCPSLTTATFLYCHGGYGILCNPWSGRGAWRRIPGKNKKVWMRQTHGL